MISRIHHEAENASNKVRTMGKRSQGLGTGAKKSFTVSRSLIVRRKKSLLSGGLLTRGALNQRAREIVHSKTFTGRVVEEFFPRSVFFFVSSQISLVPSFLQNFPCDTTLFGFTGTGSRKRQAGRCWIKRNRR